MVGTPARALALFALVLPLASCVFFVSAFPPLLTQVVARTDLSAVIPAANAQDYTIYAVTATAAPSGDFVILMNRNGSVDPRVVVLDASLHLIQTYTLSQLNGWGTFNGFQLMMDASGDIEIGNFQFAALDLLTKGQAPSATTNPPVSGPGFCSPANSKNDINFSVMPGNLLSYTQYALWASLDFSASVFIGGGGTSFNVLGVFNASATTPGEVILILSESSNATIHIVQIPLTDVLTNSIQNPILDRYPNASYTNVDSSSIGYAGDSLVAYSYDSHALVRYAVSPPFGTLGQLPVGQIIHPTSYAYKADGSYSIQFDQTTRILTKVAKWW